MNDLNTRIEKIQAGNRPVWAFAQSAASQASNPLSAADVSQMETKLNILNEKFTTILDDVKEVAVLKLLPLLWLNPLYMRNNAETGHVPNLVYRFAGKTVDEFGKKMPERFLVSTSAEENDDHFVVAKQQLLKSDQGKKEWQTVGAFEGNQAEVLEQLQNTFAATFSQHRQAMPAFWRAWGAAAVAAATVGTATAFVVDRKPAAALPEVSATAELER